MERVSYLFIVKLKHLKWILPLALLSGGYKYHVSEVSQHVAKEAVLASQIDAIEKARRIASERSKFWQAKYTAEVVKVSEAEKKTAKTRIIYVEARAATDSLPDSLNLAREVRAARELISDQEGHIKALLELQQSSDSLLHMRLREIRFYEKEVAAWQDRVDNLKAQKDEEIKQIKKEERRKGRNKFFKGLAAGAGAVALLVIL